MQWAEKVKQLQNLTKPLNQNRMEWITIGLCILGILLCITYWIENNK